MSISKEEAVKALQTRDHLFVAFSQATKHPYVTCDEETYNDQAWIFATEAQVKAFISKKSEEKIPLGYVNFEKKDFPRLYGSLYSIGVNAVVWNSGDESREVELKDIAREADMSKIEPAKRPLYNPALQLSAIYFMQEMRRPIPQEEKKDLTPQWEEVIANLLKSEYYVAFQVDPENKNRLGFPFLKANDGRIVQPFFADLSEFSRFAAGKNLRAAKMPFVALAGLLNENSSGFVLNPMSINLVLTKEQVMALVPKEKLEEMKQRAIQLQMAAKQNTNPEGN